MLSLCFGFFSLRLHFGTLKVVDGHSKEKKQFLEIKLTEKEDCGQLRFIVAMVKADML